jgi:oxygen-independent coproporphyrinogen-3 oxidase
MIREIDLGGGTPTFFSPLQLKKLLQFILKDSIVHPQRWFSIEGHPNNTTPEHLKTLQALGFTRISYGVQDNGPDVQRVINRIQPFENVVAATEAARRAGFSSINFDLIYGLPLQTVDSMERTINEVLTLRPDRIAFYSYAHVPWTSKAQRLFNESHLPSAEEKLALYLKGKELLLQGGYADIGMDHFALPNDELYKAKEQGTLHRNFIGYTTQPSGLLLGLGVSSISDIGTAYAQNEKTLHDYYAAIDASRLAIRKGYFLSSEDAAFKTYILDIACRGRTRLHNEHLPLLKESTFPVLKILAADGLVKWNEDEVAVTGAGHYFIRNICSAFDLYLKRTAEKPLFSKAI